MILPAVNTKWMDAAWLGAIMALGLAVRLYGLRAESATGDEVFTLQWIAAESPGEFLRQSFAFDPTARLAPVYGLLAYAWACVFGPGLMASRLLPLLLGVSCLPLFYALGMRLAGRAPALLATAMAALSLPHIFYSQDVRFYALFNLLALISMGTFLRMLESPRKRWWILHAAANAALLWTHAFAPLLWAVQGAYLLLFARRRVVPWALAHAAIAMLFAGWLLALGYHLGTESNAYHDRLAGWREAGVVLLMFAGGRFSEENPAAYMPGGISLDKLLGLAFLAAAGAAVLGAWRSRSVRTNEFRAIGLLFLWLAIPPVLLVLLSETWRMVFYPRYILHAVFAVSLLFAIGVNQCRHGSIRILLSAAAIGMLVYQVLALPRPFRADYQAAAREIRQDAGAAVHALKPFNARATAYALGMPDYRAIENWGLPELCEEVIGQARQGRVVWALFHRWDRTAEFEAAMARAGMQCKLRRYAGMPPLFGYRVLLADGHGAD